MRVAFVQQSKLAHLRQLVSQGRYGCLEHIVVWGQDAANAIDCDDEPSNDGNVRTHLFTAFEGGLGAAEGSTVVQRPQAEMAEAPVPEDACCIMYTSGTTGET